MMKPLSKMEIAWGVAAFVMLGAGLGCMEYFKAESDRLLSESVIDDVRGADLNEILRPVLSPGQKLSRAEGDQLLIDKFADGTLKPIVIVANDGFDDDWSSLSGVSVTLKIVAAEVVHKAYPQYPIDPHEYAYCVVYVAENLLSTQMAALACGTPGAKVPHYD